MVDRGGTATTDLRNGARPGGVAPAVTAPRVPDSHQDLLDAATAVLATIGPDGRPQLTAVWFLRDGDDVRLSLNTDRQKVKNLVADPAVTLFVLDPVTPQRYLEIRGDAVMESDPDYAFAARVGAKYDADLRAFDAEGAERVVVTLRPERINAVDMTGA
jgi:PPOX class probable F420-dependent enzyme